MGTVCTKRPPRRFRKKKDLKLPESAKQTFEAPKAPITFLPPEAFGSETSPDGGSLFDELLNAQDWDIAVRYHEFKAMASKRLPSGESEARIQQLRRLSAQAILARAQEVLGSVVHPLELRSGPWEELPSDAIQPDIDFEETLENSSLAVTKGPMTAQDIWMSYSVRRRQPVILSVDTSLSMTGEKLALTAVALAVVLLQFPADPVGIIAFENDAKILKYPDEDVSLPVLLERFLDVPAQGYTHLEEGMKTSLRLIRRTMSSAHGRPPSTVLLTDGKYTAGRDPAYLAPKFPHLIILKMGQERASLDLCRELAQKGKGALKEVAELESLPTVMYSVVKDLLRGRSLS